MYAVIDIETTGGNFHKEAMTEVAVLITDGQRLIDSWSSLLNPGKSIPIEVSRITGITNEMVRNAPSFPMVARRIVEMTEGCTLVGHNVSFDYSFIRENFRRLGHPVYAQDEPPGLPRPAFIQPGPFMPFAEYRGEQPSPRFGRCPGNHGAAASYP